jgi:hypothetical protein
VSLQNPVLDAALDPLGPILRRDAALQFRRQGLGIPADVFEQAGVPGPVENCRDDRQESRAVRSGPPLSPSMPANVCAEAHEEQSDSSVRCGSRWRPVAEVNAKYRFVTVLRQAKDAGTLLAVSGLALLGD